MSDLSWWNKACAVFVLCAATAIATPAQTFTTLVNFDGANGSSPEYMSLIQGIDGDLYGTTTSGGANDQGTVFKLTRNGVLTTLYSFCALPDCADGAGPAAGLVLGTDGNFYGTAGGGVYGEGVIFKMTSKGKLTTLHSFCKRAGCLDGAAPLAGLIQATDGALYGTTYYGGTGSCTSGCGTVFKITKDGRFTAVADFERYTGHYPNAPLIQANGEFYGTTTEGGRQRVEKTGTGTIYTLSDTGELSDLYVFCSFECSGDYAGQSPMAGLFQGVEGILYGTAYEGGYGGAGTVYKFSELPVSTVYPFCMLPSCADGAFPVSPVIQATDGNLYGTTTEYPLGEGYYGTVFEHHDGGLATLHTFCSQANCADGYYPYGGLLQATDGNFYGTTYGGYGTVFKLSTGLGPFVSFVHNPAKIGQPFGILGQGFTGTTSVSLNGTPASFTVKSDTFIEATVPAGATTGYVTVTTPTGTLTSNVPFQVIP